MLKACVAEALGTFGLVFLGTGAIVVNTIHAGVLTHVGVALSFGLVVMAMILAFGVVSGSHFNPAVTLALAAGGHVPWGRLGGYIPAQCLGAVAASALLCFLFPGQASYGATRPSGPDAQSWILEALLSAGLMFVILGVVHEVSQRAAIGAIAIGGTIALEALVGGPISGASMNPARSLGPALVAQDTGKLWIYLSAPPAGMLVAVVLGRWLYAPTTTTRG